MFILKIFFIQAGVLIFVPAGSYNSYSECTEAAVIIGKTYPTFALYTCTVQ